MIQSSWHETNPQHKCLQFKADRESSRTYQLLLRVMQYPRIFTWDWVTRLCHYSVGGITGRATWIMHFFVFEWGDVMRVSLFGINVTSVLQDHTLSF